MIPLTDLERIANGGHWDSTQAPQIARELIAARNVIAVARTYWGNFSRRLEKMASNDGLSEEFRTALRLYDAAREAE